MGEEVAVTIACDVLRNFSHAEYSYRESIQIIKSRYGKYHPKVGARMKTLASLLREKGKLNEALFFAKEAEVSFSSNLPETSQLRSNIYITIGRIYLDQENYEEAERI